MHVSSVSSYLIFISQPAMELCLLLDTAYLKLNGVHKQTYSG